MNQVILITGTSSGFGYETTKILADAAHTVYASMRHTTTSNKQSKEHLLEYAVERGLDLHVIDVVDQQSISSGIQQIIQEQGKIDVLVNNAGVVSYGVNESFQLQQVRNMFEVNFFAAVRMNNEVLPHMRKQGSGLLVHVSSVLGRLVVPSMGIYAASKFALEALAESYRYDLAGTGVDSVVVAPGGYPTSLNDKPDTPAKESILDTYGDMGKLGGQLLHNMRTGLGDRDITEIAQTIKKLIDQENRPLRTGLGVEAELMIPLNDYAAEIQTTLLKNFGMTELMSLAR